MPLAMPSSIWNNSIRYDVPKGLSNAANAATPKASVNITLCVPSAPFNSCHGTSLTTANNMREKK